MSIKFQKYTSCGNNFVLIDETRGEQLGEKEKSQFALAATSMQFGIGSDNLIAIQECTSEVLASINSKRAYWSGLPKESKADFVFRMFEPDGTEAFSCGNGLMSVAKMLYHKYGTEKSRIITEVPFKNPRVVQIGANESLAWANMGQPRRVPSQLVNVAARRPLSTEVDLLSKLTISFREHDLEPYSDRRKLDIEGYLVFTGEPHLVLVPDEIFPGVDLANTMFGDPTDGPLGSSSHIRDSFGTWLVERIGSYINRNCQDIFPTGLNVCFARRSETESIVEYRCYERGIEKETLACGTGALAVAFVMNKIWGRSNSKVAVHPVVARQYHAHACINVEETGRGWVISSAPFKVCEGEYGDAEESRTRVSLQSGQDKLTNETEGPRKLVSA